MPRRIVDPSTSAPGFALPDPSTAAAREAIRAELKRRAKLPEAVLALESTYFPPQAAFAADPAPRVVSCSGRRGGKTVGLGGRILRVASAFPGEVIPVFERAQTTEASRVLWKALHDLDAKHQLGCGFSQSRMICTLPNRAEITILGADTLEAADKARGGRYPAAFVDEAGTFRPHILEYLLTDVLEPALSDFGGTLTVTGTPTPRRLGPFFEICRHAGLTGDGPGDGTWSGHRWTYLDNDSLPLNHEHLSAAERAALRLAEMERRLKARGLTVHDPRVRREWFGEWVDETTDLVYQLRDYNYRGVTMPDLSAPGWRFVIGLDLGIKDPTAFVVLAYRDDQPDLFVVESWEEQDLLPDHVGVRLEKLRARYGATTPVVMDAGSLGGLQTLRMLQARLGMRVHAADKRGKFTHIGFMNADFGSGRLKLVEGPNRDLIADLAGLRLAPPAPDGSVRLKEHPADDNHLPDALLYACTFLQGARRGLADRDQLEPGSAAWRDARIARALELDAQAHAPKSASELSALDAAVSDLG